MMSTSQSAASVHLPSIIIDGYRPFQHLDIPHFGQINLIVGQNNVGKSSLLEALWVYVKHAAPSVLYQILEDRDEYIYRKRIVRLAKEQFEENGDPRLWKAAIESLFFNRPIVGLNGIDHAQIAIGLSNKPMSDQLIIKLGLLNDAEKFASDDNLGLTVIFQNNKILKQSILDSYLRTYNRSNLSLQPTSEPIVYIRSENLASQEIQNLWDQVALQPSEDIVLDSLRLIAPKIERLSFISSGESSRVSYPIVRLKGMKMPIPLKSLGEGMARLLGIALSLVNVQNGILLIDEIDTGLHYSVQDAVWRLIFETAQKLNVQVFATTHSKDTIHSFQRIANQHKAEGMLISLRSRQKDGVIVSVPYSEEELAIATESDIEVR